MTIGVRLREERERLELSQPSFASTAGTTKQTVFSWETGKTAPDGFQLAALGEAGVDVLYVLTGVKAPSIPAMDVAERLLVENYRRCNDDGKAHLLQTSTLLVAGIAGPSKVPRRKAAAKEEGVQISQMSMNSDGGVQVGYAGGKVTVKRGR